MIYERDPWIQKANQYEHDPIGFIFNHAYLLTEYERKYIRIDIRNDRVHVWFSAEADPREFADELWYRYEEEQDLASEDWEHSYRYS